MKDVRLFIFMENGYVFRLLYLDQTLFHLDLQKCDKIHRYHKSLQNLRKNYCLDHRLLSDNNIDF
jgi:hypothetical protein